MSIPRNYGSRYWVICCKDYEICLFADKIEVSHCGTLLAWGGYRDTLNDSTNDPVIVYAISNNEWTTFYAASFMDGSAVAACRE